MKKIHIFEIDCYIIIEMTYHIFYEVILNIFYFHRLISIIENIVKSVNVLQQNNKQVSNDS